ncbi:MAG: DNA metabolism protein [Chitinophagaceae bacterium]|nr:MAG: DNA metabolism protein [Chitinophagaceae bacterium]
MTIVQYDGTFAGLLTAIFEVYEYKLPHPNICRQAAASGSLFGNSHEVFTNEQKQMRVFKKLQDKLNPKAVKQLYDCLLSEEKGIENVILRYVQYALSTKLAVENNYANPDVLYIQQLSRKVHREKHRMEAFVRFQLTKDDLYYAIIQPDYNVLPLICKHFKDRYADQRWLIYDGLRKYGLYYDLETVQEVQMNFTTDTRNAQTLTEIFDDKEELYQQLWKQYFSSVNIVARKNMKLHIQHMPKRYWRYLVEKQ